MPRLVTLSPSAARTGPILIWLEDVIAAQVTELFPGESVQAVYAFCLTRGLASAEASLVTAPEEARPRVRPGLTGRPVRLTVQRTMPAAALQILMENLGCAANAGYRLGEPLGLRDLALLYTLDRPDLKNSPACPARPSTPSP